MTYITGSNNQSKYSVIGHIQLSYLNWDSFVDCFKYLIAWIYGCRRDESKTSFPLVMRTKLNPCKAYRWK